MSWFWLSYVDPSASAGSRFLGACIVGPTDAFLGAVALAHVRKCSPGGEVAGAEIPPGIEAKIPETYRNRLLTREECESFDELIGSQPEEEECTHCMGYFFRQCERCCLCGAGWT